MKDKRLRSGYGKHNRPITITLLDGEVIAKVSLGKHKIMIIDLADIEILKDHSLYAHKRSDGQYVARSSQTGAYVHRIILNAMSSDVDHVNHQPLDNRKVNLRECSSMQNQLARNAKELDGFYGLYKIQDACEQPYIQNGRVRGMVNKHDVWGYYNPDGSKNKQRFRDVIDAAFARDNEYYEYYKDSYDVWHTYNFINWNFLFECELSTPGADNPCTSYMEWLKKTAQEQSKKAIKWLNNTSWGMNWFMHHIDTGEANTTPHEGMWYMNA